MSRGISSADEVKKDEVRLKVTHTLNAIAAPPPDVRNGCASPSSFYSPLVLALDDRQAGGLPAISRWSSGSDTTG